MSNGGQERRKGPSKRVIIILVVAAVCVVVALLGYKAYAKTHVSTDDAFVDGRIHTIAAKINGTVKALYVVDNQLVKKGDVLVEIDPVDYSVRVDEAGASLSMERSRVAEAGVRISVAKAQEEEMTDQAEASRIGLEVQKKNLVQAQLDIKKAQAGLEAQEARLRQAEQDIKRADGLFAKEAISREKYENVQTARDVAEAQEAVAREQLAQAQSAADAQGSRVTQAEMDVKRADAALRAQQKVLLQAEIGTRSQEALARQREATLRTAELNLSYTKIYAPVDGFVSKRSVEVGNQVQAGQPLLAIVPLEGTWVTANYKETQLEKVRPGQKVYIEVDSYPGKTFTGKVDSVMAGTGSAFSLFPPENATGNYVKVVQRVPVKIVLDQGTDPDHALRVGLSVIPTIVTK
jgi:membrane fusion protein (multidrug efflux system)